MYHPATKALRLRAASHCPDCGRALCGGSEHRCRQVIEIPPTPVQVTDYVQVTDHVVMARWCGVCQKRVLPKLDLSDQVVGQHRVWVRLMKDFRMSLVGWLHTVRQRCWVHFLRDLYALTQAHHPNKTYAGRGGARVGAFGAGVCDAPRTWQSEAGAAVARHGKAVGNFGSGVFARRAKRKAFEEQLYALALPHLEQEVPQRIASFLPELFVFVLFVFVEHVEVPSENNAAERSVRGGGDCTQDQWRNALGAGFCDEDDAAVFVWDFFVWDFFVWDVAGAGA